jgi:glycosyltransferase involved in cell wall biosynthesis
MSDLTVSVILPVYNGENYLRFAVESVLAQTLRDFELIVVDDGSKDSTPELMRAYGDPRVRYVRQQNTGVAGAFNHGIRIARGRYISWLSHDDRFMPEKLERQVGALAACAGPAVSYTDVQMIDSRGCVITEYRLPEHGREELLRNVMSCGLVCMASYSVLYDRRCVEEVGPYSERWRYTQDAEMLMRLARRFPLVRVPELLMQVREHEGRGIRSEKWEREVVEFYSEHLGKLPFEELFPESGASGRERSEGYLKVGDTFAIQPFPLYRVAFSQYRRALRENPADAARLLRRMAGLYRLHLRRRFGRGGAA